ncbi:MULTISPECIES: hypothetical protein [Paenibacillus]|uniref:hypothetical protein n=1 Tax=Paenibacillus TaxID=44249 RepID=UPI000413A38C|nr:MULTISPECIES: hypothetical protein [Paenibacillus]KGP82109.1 hypothetical protein P364_0113710 [Paenibacillus sp. MAEPY2]KGP84786.1 hypothetical protein P363_0123120 [Paenibacillus sp. MAEPY1]OZQ62657.1 hypothetical protein CA599_25855 [Paenibacillus taichungensis]HBU81534.1 hypothetical protein [Paenibacillus sp.]
MLLTLSVIVTAGLIGWFDLPGLIRRKEWKETIVYSALLLLATFLSVFAVNLWEFPSPLYLIIWIYEPVNQFLAHLTGT